jgi:phosphopantothenoylcysteine decarboxylase/phosphopantothenate--cysteine ligase
VSGGIAAYKTAYLVSRLVQAGAGVTVAMTPSARRFVGRATFEGLTGREVATRLWGGGDICHLKLSESADLIIVAPATANCLGKLAGGLADDLVSALLLGAACPVMLAPAMNQNMWRHPAVQRNVSWLREQGFHLVGPGSGWQACRTVGAGRMSEPEAILSVALHVLAGASNRRTQPSTDGSR